MKTNEIISNTLKIYFNLNMRFKFPELQIQKCKYSWRMGKIKSDSAFGAVMKAKFPKADD